MSKEQLFNQSDILLSTTDTSSHIKYADKSFCDIAGFSLEELEGNPHNMVRKQPSKIYGHIFNLDCLGWGQLKINVKMVIIIG